MKKRILLADDDASIRQMLGRILELESHHVLPASTGRQAVALVLEMAPDLALLDLNMPDKDGWEAFCLIKTVQPLLPVIVITARPYQYEKAVIMQAHAFMEKPLNLPLLLATVRGFLRESDRGDAARFNSPNFKTLFLNRQTELLSAEIHG